MDYQALAEQAKSARAVIATASTQTKNSALLAIKEAMAASRLSILQANLKDLDAGQNQGLDEALLDRLELNDARIDGMIRVLSTLSLFPIQLVKFLVWCADPLGSKWV
jgi:glutamate-5-semialdehyde dehydrogenase